VKTTAFDLQMGPAHPYLSFDKLDRAKDEHFWSLRTNSDVIVKTEPGGDRARGRAALAVQDGLYPDHVDVYPISGIHRYRRVEMDANNQVRSSGGRCRDPTSLDDYLIEPPLPADVPAHAERRAASDSLGLFDDVRPPAAELHGLVPEAVILPA
jgi:hypothetical protein